MSEPQNPATQSILIVEDDTIIASALRMLFERRGWAVRVASTVRQGKTQLDPSPDWLIVDLMLPDGDGADLLREIRSRELPTKVVIATGVQDPQRLDAVRELRPEALLQKPVSFSQLLNVFGTR